MSDDDVLAFTRGVRVKVVKQLVTEVGCSSDNSDRNLLVNMLNGLDNQAINSKKIAADQKNNDNMAAVVAEMLRTVNKQTAFTIPTNGEVIDVDVSTRVVGHEVADIPALPGEMDVSPPQLDYATFVRSQGKDIDQLGKNVKHDEAAVDPDDDLP
ncbi:hypothetical protein [Ralstonia phage RP12]|uniref:Uncharacterized protein n=1 Tax=Ralstonia phage RP12 TaxID=1923889 RepID=A0A1L7N0P0_9CAUD|nr:hypothetical protein FDH28_gp051 [Ralstonia phage RP12]BAW19025.1 hypothetical protein [Ralstonia phage RP12]